MKLTRSICRIFTAGTLLFLAGLLLGQGTLEDYKRADKFWIPTNIPIFKLEIIPRWIGGGPRFWYMNKTRYGNEFILVDPIKNKKIPAFDHARIADCLSQASGKKYSSHNLPFNSIEFINEEKAIQINFDGAVWIVNLTTYECEKTIKKRYSVYELPSPDGKLIAFVKNYNLYVRSVETGEERRLSSDGVEFYDYATPVPNPRTMISQQTQRAKQPVGATWSPDSKKLAAYRIDQRKAGTFTLVQSTPSPGQRPLHYTYAYPLPGDKEVTWIEPVIFDVEQNKQIPVNVKPIAHLFYGAPEFHWFADSRRVFFRHIERDYKTVRIVEVDAETGDTRILLEERTEPHYDYLIMDYHVIGDGEEIIWMSERDGWNHFYLYDGKCGEIKNQITKGKWVVFGGKHFGFLSVDQKNRRLYFTAGGREENRDPYLRHVYRVNLDGSDLTLLTPENADHQVNFSPDNRYFTDSYSRVDTAPVSVLRRCSDGKIVMELEKADIELLLKTGWQWPEPFKVKARDGKTDIYGVIWRPSNFDPSKKYPVVEDFYPGPHGFHTPKTFYRGFYYPVQSIAELGFITVIVDGMGTNYRSRAFGDVSYGNLGDCGTEDHIAALRQLATRYPYMDLSRGVGAYGHSAGGYGSLHILLTHPEFYKVAVPSAGNHDFRIDRGGYIELYMGYPVGKHYEEQSNVTLAHKLEGKLMLVQGELDDDVHPSSALQVVDALIRANKDFDLLYVPNGNHGLRINPYFIRRLWDYFVKHLLGVEPPKEYRITSPPPVLKSH